MPRRLSTFAFLLCLIAAAKGTDRPARYVAMLANGQRLEGHKLRDWHDEQALPLLDGQPLLAPANPLRWLRDRSQSLAEVPAACIEFTNGDRLPGVVIDYKSGLEKPFDPEPPHLIVQVPLAFEPPENRPVTEIRVLTQYVRRVVWQRSTVTQHKPATATFRDGRSQDFRALRWRAGEVQVLSADGERRIDWNELAELNLSAIDSWIAWFDQLAAICPDTKTRLIEIETSTGLLATASLARFAARFEGNSSDADRWVHGVQPAWSLDILWVPFREIAFYRTFAPQEVPLSRLTPRRISQHSSLGTVQEPQINRNALGQALASQTLDFGFGLGVRGSAEIAYDLPPGACSLRTSVCLDREAGSGGCIRPRIFANQVTGEPLWEGPVIVGSGTVVASEVIRFAGATAGQTAVVLQIDSVTADRPRGADPLDIRDYANWCDPLWEFDPAVVESEIRKRWPERFAAWREWSLETGEETQRPLTGLDVAFHRNDELPGSFETAVSTPALPLILRRDLMIGARDHWLVIAARRLRHENESPKIEVRLSGKLAATFSVPAYQNKPDDAVPLAVPLQRRQGETAPIAVEIRQLAAPGSGGVHYRSIFLAEQLPTLRRLLPSPLHLPPGGRFRLELPTTMPTRAAPQWGESRMIRFTVKKQGGGQVAIEFEDDQPRERTARYDLGSGDQMPGPLNRISPERLPNDWIVITRDLHADFGNLDLKAITFTCAGGEDLTIGSFDLARTRVDFDLVPAEK